MHGMVIIMANITVPNTTGVAMRLPLPTVARLIVDGRAHHNADGTAWTYAQMAASIVAAHYGDASFVPSSKSNHTAETRTDAEIRTARKTRRDARKSRVSDALSSLAQSLVAPKPAGVK